MEIKILGAGCRRCKALTRDVNDVVSNLGVDAQVDKVERMDEILKYDILLTPGLVIDGELKATGRVPSKSEIKKWIQEKI